MPNGDVQKLITAIGSIAEMEALHFKALIGHGLSRQEALELTQTYLVHMLNKPKPGNPNTSKK